MEKIILKYALQNAILYGGKANPGAVVGKVIKELPNLKDDMKELHKQVKAAVAQVNKMSLSQQTKTLGEIAPELLEKHEKKEKDIFAFLGIKEGERIVTAFPPGPEKYPHIGHAKALFLNFLLAQRYHGKFILRFEDTNPLLVRKEFYDIMQENFRWLGVSWDELLYASDYMEVFYQHAVELIAQGHAYMCSCTIETMRALRQKGVACPCRTKEPSRNTEEWSTFSDMREGDRVLRLKIDMQHKNTTMRDPTIFRIVDAEHARHQKKYRIWPTYDFQNAVLDGKTGVTHRLRSKEFELRNELQRLIQELLGYPKTSIYEFARFNMQGVESSGRVIREAIARSELVGWDDPSLTTIVALRRRGFLPEAIKNFVISTGITKAESTLTWDDLIVQNKRLLDDRCERYFFVWNPVSITINKAPEHEIHLKKHPEHPERGYREYKAGSEFYITKDDAQSLKARKLYRLMDCCNFTKSAQRYLFHSLEYEKYKTGGEKIIHYLPKLPNLMNVSVLMPDKSVVKGIAEPLVQNLKEGDVIQFERFGFCRLDRKEPSLLTFWYAHN